MANFEYLLEKTDPLNVQESIDACVLALKKNQNDLVRRWLGEPGKLACTEEMGDAIKPFDSELALAVYLRAQAPHKVIRCYAESEQFDKIVHHSQTIGYQEEDYLFLLQSILSDGAHEQGVKLASKLVAIKDKSGKQAVNTQLTVDVFVKANLAKPCLDFLLDILKTDTKADGALQTRLFEIYFAHDAAAAKSLLDSKRFTFYDKKRIAQLCEKHGYLKDAFDLHQTMADKKRVFASKAMAKLLNSEEGKWINEYLSKLNVTDVVQCLETLLSSEGTDRQSVAKLTVDLYRKQLGSREVVESLSELNLSREIAQYCESRGWNSERIRFLLRLKNAHLWSSVLTSGISTLPYFIEEIVDIAMGSDPDQSAISCLVKAMTNASLSSDLMAILESLLLESKLNSRTLKNTLLLTAIKLANQSNDNSRVMDYAMRLNDYDGGSIAEMAESHELFEEAFAIYRKFGDNKSALLILLNKIGDLDRAREFAKQCNDPALLALLPQEVLEMTEEQGREPSEFEERQMTVIDNREDGDDEMPALDSVESLVLPESPPNREEILLSELPTTRSPVVAMKSKKKLPPIGATKANNNVPKGFQLAEFASKVNIKKNARRVLQMNSSDIQRWLNEIGLGRYADRFARYNGQMLDNLYSLHFSAPEFFCQSVSSKLDADLDNVIVFFGGLSKLYGDQR